MGSGALSPSGGHFGVGRFARGKGTQSYEARFSPSRSPFPGTSLLCVVVCYNVLERILYSTVLVVWELCRWVCGERKAVCVADLFLFDVYLGTNLFLAVLFWEINLFLTILSLKTKLLLSFWPYPREQARCAGRFPVRQNKKIGSARHHQYSSIQD